MPQPFEPVSPGQPFRPSAYEWNQLGETVRTVRDERVIFKPGELLPPNYDLIPYLITQDDGSGNPMWFARIGTVIGKRLDVSDSNPCMVPGVSSDYPEEDICINAIQGFIATGDIVWTVRGGLYSPGGGHPDSQRRIAVSAAGRQVWFGTAAADITPSGAGYVDVTVYTTITSYVTIRVLARSRMTCTIRNGDRVTGVFTDCQPEGSQQFQIVAAPCCCGTTTTTPPPTTTTTPAPTTTTTPAPTTTTTTTTAAPTTTTTPAPTTTTTAPTTTTVAPTTTTAAPTTTTTAAPTTTTASPTTTTTTTSAPCSGNCNWQWDALGSVWALVGNSCVGGCGSCGAQYPSFNGTFNGQTTSTPCV